MGTAVAAVAARARRDILDHLRLARALDAASAVPVPELPSFIAERQLARLERAGVVRRAGSGVYLDEHAYVAWRDAQRQRVLVALVIAALVLAIFLMLNAMHTPPQAS